MREETAKRLILSMALYKVFAASVDDLDQDLRQIVKSRYKDLNKRVQRFNRDISALDNTMDHKILEQSKELLDILTPYLDEKFGGKEEPSDKPDEEVSTEV